MKEKLFLLLLPLLCVGQGYAQEKSDLEKVHAEIVRYLEYPEGGEKLFFRTENAITLRDSFTVIAIDSFDNDWYACAVINHNKWSQGHDLFSDEFITRWKEDRWESGSHLLEKVKGLHREMDVALLKDLKGYWIYVRPYRGEFYIDNDWATLMAQELTDSTWVQIDMEVFPRPCTALYGDHNAFTLVVDGDPILFELVDPEREIYRVGKTRYMIPNRRRHEFPIIEYIGTTGDLISLSIPFDE